MFSMVISVISEVISVDFGDFGESCYPIFSTIFEIINGIKGTSESNFSDSDRP